MKEGEPPKDGPSRRYRIYRGIASPPVKVKRGLLGKGQLHDGAWLDTSTKEIWDFLLTHRIVDSIEIDTTIVPDSPARHDELEETVEFWETELFEPSKVISPEECVDLIEAHRIYDAEVFSDPLGRKCLILHVIPRSIDRAAICIPFSEPIPSEIPNVDSGYHLYNEETDYLGMTQGFYLMGPDVTEVLQRYTYLQITDPGLPKPKR